MAENRPRKLNLRLDEELRAQLAAAARRSVRSLQTEIEYRLRTSFEHKSDDRAGEHAA